MTIQQLAQLIRQSPSTILRRCGKGDIPAKRVKCEKWGGWLRWEIDEKWVTDLLKGETYSIESKS